ncbi:MAG TPA: hypothetical protein VH518_06140 [Tepidisphaeraceae bacterium]|jgi:hypothetical protein
MTFATDINLLHWEPNLLKDASAVAQTLLSGTGTLSGTTFTIDAGSLSSANVSDEYAIVIADPIGGTFPIVSVNTSTTLTLSVLYDQLFPDEGDVEPFVSGSGSALGYTIRTFWPQRRVVSELLLQAAGLRLDQAPLIQNPEALQRPCTLGALHMIYTALAAAAAEPADQLIRAELYEKLYRRALKAAVVDLDLDGDGIIDTTRRLGVLELQRV